jgi:hypothetical protein
MNLSSITKIDKKTIFLVSTPTIIFLLISVIDAYASPESVCGLAGANSTAVHTCIASYLHYQKMNQYTDQWMQKSLDANKDSVRHEQLLQNQTQYHEWVIAKPNMSKAMTTSDLEKRSWYDNYMKDNLHQMTMEIKWWKQYDHNPMPMPVTCPAWHVCGSDNRPLNMTQLEHEIKSQKNATLSKSNSTILLKPEFTNHTSGYLTTKTLVKNWQDFAQWFALNQTYNHH